MSSKILRKAEAPGDFWWLEMASRRQSHEGVRPARKMWREAADGAGEYACVGEARKWELTNDPCWLIIGIGLRPFSDSEMSAMGRLGDQ